MLERIAKKRRFLEITQIVLAFASVTAVADATHSQAVHDARSYHGTRGGEDNDADRRFSDLARSERKRREAAQRSSRRGIELAARGAAGVTNPGR